MKTRVTVESITAELDAAQALATRVEQPGAAIQAIATKAKLHGLLIDRKETGQPGDFQAAQSVAEVLAKVRAELGDDAARALQALVGQGAASDEAGQADNVVPFRDPGDTLN